MPTILITGATDGIGLETARQMLAKGWRVLVHGRSEERAGEALSALKAAGGKASALWGDLSEMAQVQALAAQAQKLAPALDVLLLNAGVYEQKRALTKDGFERTMGINHFAHLLLAMKLRKALAAASAPRVVWVSSMVHVGASLDLEDLDLAKSWGAYEAYGASNLANAATAAEMAHRNEWLGVLSFSLHPGVVATKLLTRNFGAGGVPTPQGVKTSIHCATAPGLEGFNGAYFNHAAPARPNSKVLDPAFTAALWDRSAERLKAWL